MSPVFKILGENLMIAHLSIRLTMSSHGFHGFKMDILDFCNVIKEAVLVQPSVMYNNLIRLNLFYKLIHIISKIAYFCDKGKCKFMELIEFLHI